MVVTASLPRVAGSGTPELPDSLPSPTEMEAAVFSDRSPGVTSGVASDFTYKLTSLLRSPLTLSQELLGRWPRSPLTLS